MTKKKIDYRDMLFYKTVDEVPTLFHLSHNPDLNHLIPLIPDGTLALNKEDYWSRRICMAPSISHCLTALDIANYEESGFVPYYVYTPVMTQLSLADIMRATIHMVRDANITKEHWILKEVDVIKIGKVINYQKVGKRKYAYTGLGKVSYSEYEYDFYQLAEF